MNNKLIEKKVKQHNTTQMYGFWKQHTHDATKNP